ncbi:expansin EXLX1 family cellulose-binding protein [Streptomyces sp. NBC_01465]|nr:expansin EXLX1 family cellulose-binding protein [Streptomyces sp. NBC_01465]
MVGAMLAVAAAGVLAYLVMALPSGSTADAGHAAATPVTTRASATTAPGTGTPTATGKPTPTAAATTKAVRPSATPRPARTESNAASGTASLSGRIRPRTVYEGVATAYEAGDGDGACLFGPSDGLMIAAMNTTDYEASKACGAYVLVRAANGASITVRITNECPAPCAPGQLDLSQQAFAKLADLKVGRIPITWQLLSPSTSDTMSLRYKTGSSRYWCGIQAIDHRNPVARLEVRTANGWRQLPRTDYNYFISADGSGCGGSIRITDIYGERLTVSGIALRPNVAQETRVQFARH